MERRKGTLIVSQSEFLFGPSDRIRTCGILLPKQARYQLRYTRSSSEWACCAPPPDIGFAGIRRLRIRAPIPPLQNEPTMLGFVLV